MSGVCHPVTGCGVYLQQLQCPLVAALFVAKLPFQLRGTVVTRLQGGAELLDGLLGSHGSRRAVCQMVFVDVRQHGQLAAWPDSR